MTSHPLYHTTPQYLWCHIHFRHDITPPLSDIAPTVSFWPQAPHWYNTNFWMTSHPPFVCHHMHYIEHHIQFLCHHTTVLMTSQHLYMKLHPACRSKYTLYMRHQSHYLCPHTHCIDNIHPGFVWHHPRNVYGIVCSIQDITSSLYDLRPPCFSDHTHYIGHRVHCICVITSTVLMISHQIYLWDHIRYNSWYRIHSTRYDSHFMTSQPLHSWHQIPYIWHHIQGLWDLVPYTCDITDTMFVNTCQLYLTSNTRC